MNTIGNITITTEFSEGDDEHMPFWGVYIADKADEYTSAAGYKIQPQKLDYKTLDEDDAVSYAARLALTCAVT